MANKTKRNQADYISPLIINGLHGRVLNLPAKKKSAKKEILMIYGHHSSVERMLGIAKDISQYGEVTMPDLPGFGGMDSYYKIGKKPTLDNLADYLATFIKLKYKQRHIVVCGMSFGFIVITRMLQKYPEMTKQIECLISIVGFSNKDDFKFKRSTYYLFRYGASLCSTKPLSFVAKHIVLRDSFIRYAYNSLAHKNTKMKDADKDELIKRINFEIILWKANDIRTYMDTTVTMMRLDITKDKIKLPLVHIAVNADQYFNNTRVKKNLNKIFKKVEIYKAKMDNHAPTVIGDEKESKTLIPKEVRKILSKTSKKRK